MSHQFVVSAGAGGGARGVTGADRVPDAAGTACSAGGASAVFGSPGATAVPDGVTGAAGVASVVFGSPAGVTVPGCDTGGGGVKGGGGVTVFCPGGGATGFSSTLVTVSVVLPLMAPEVAEIVVAPAPTEVAKPALFTVATPVLELVQVAVPVMFWVTPLL